MTAIARGPENAPKSVVATEHEKVPEPSKNPGLRGPVVLATKGSSDSPSAFVIAQLIARNTKRKLNIISVVQPLIYYGLPPEIQPGAFAIDARSTADREADLMGALLKGTQPGLAISVDVRLGQVALEVCDSARDLDATMTVVGASPHRRVRRVFAGHRAAQILHRATAPVLSVAPWLKALPRNVVAAIDFNPASVRAAETALLLMEEGSKMTLVHVMPPNFIFPSPVAPDDSLRESIQAELEKIASILKTRAGAPVTINVVVLSGDATTKILDFVERTDVDLLAVGTQAGSAFRRMLVGSVATDLFHTALCSVLASPPPSFADSMQLDLEMRGTAAASNAGDFGAVLEAFTARNRGKLVSLEEDDELLGAQIQVRGYKLRSIGYDKTRDLVEIMLGAPDSLTAHITRAISGVKSVAVTQGTGAAGMALQIRHGRAQTLVMIDPRTHIPT